MQKRSNIQAVSNLRLLAALATVAVAIAAATAAVAPRAGASPAAPKPDDGFTLVWGTGAAPTYAAASPAPVRTYARPGDVELVWGLGGPPRYVPAR